MNNEKRYMCSSEKQGKVVDITFVSNLASAHVYEAIGHSQGCKCVVHDMTHTNQRVILKEEVKPHAHKKWAKRVRCVETGEIWESVSVFQNFIGMKRWALESRIRHKVPINGKTYEFYNEPLD